MSANSQPPDVIGAANELCQRFGDALRRGDRPRIEVWLLELGPVGESALPKLVVLELDHLIRAGEHVAASDYFARFPRLRSDPGTARELVVTEFHATRSRDPNVTEATYRDRYPDLADAFLGGDEPDGTITQKGTIPFREPPAEPPADHRHPSPHDPTAFLRTLLDPSDRAGDLGVLGDYRIPGVLGHGGMGVVLRGEDTVLHRTVALKVMRPEVAANPVAKERFLREARAMAAVAHPRIVVIHQIGEWKGTPFLVMPLMTGCSLGQRLRNDPPIPLVDAVRFAREAADGLAAAHARGLVHRDVKPDNIWLEETADGVHVRLLDFGLARDDADTPMTAPGTVFGTPSYMAPEQAGGERVDGRADLFSLGCVLFELATGQKAFRGPSVTSILFALANHVPPAPRAVNPSVPEPLSRLIQRLLAKAREDRPASAGEVAALLKAMEAEPVTAIETGSAATVVRQPVEAPKSNRRAWIIGGAVALALCLAAVVARPLFPDKRPDAAGSDGATGVAPPTATPPIEQGATAPPDGKSEPLRVKSLDVKHFAKTDEGDVPKGILGKDSFAPLLGDRVQVVARLSRPAYAYVVAFRPDGVAELCFPDTEDTVPSLTDTPRYPAADSGKAYGLREGTGLWVFVVIASERPLPAYKQWLFDKKQDWKRELAPAGLVWWYDGAELETLGKGVSTTRGKDEKLEGPASTVRALGRALQEIPDAKIGVIGFGVGPKN